MNNLFGLQHVNTFDWRNFPLSRWRLEDSTGEMKVGEADDRLGRLAFAILDEFIARGCPEWMIELGVQVGECLEDVLPRQALGDQLGQLVGPRGRRWDVLSTTVPILAERDGSFHHPRVWAERFPEFVNMLTRMTRRSAPR